MGELINLNPQSGIPDEITRDTELVAAIAAHNTQEWVHLDYLYRVFVARDRSTQSPPTYVIPAEVTNAIVNHAAAADPHPVYLTQAEGDGLYRQSAVALTDADIPTAIARDAEVTSAIAAHAASGDSHSRQWGGQKGHYHYDSLDFNDPNIPLGWIWIRAGGTITNSFVDSLPGSYGAQCFLLSLNLGFDMPNHRFQIAFPIVGSSTGCWTRTLMQGNWASWIRV